MSTEVVHRLGVIVWGALALGWLARSLWAARRRRLVRRRLAELLALEAASSRRRLELRGVGRRWLPVVGAVCAGWVLVGGSPEVWWDWRPGSGSGGGGSGGELTLSRSTTGRGPRGNFRLPPIWSRRASRQARAP